MVTYGRRHGPPPADEKDLTKLNCWFDMTGRLNTARGIAAATVLTVPDGAGPLPPLFPAWFGRDI